MNGLIVISSPFLRSRLGGYSAIYFRFRDVFVENFGDVIFSLQVGLICDFSLSKPSDKISGSFMDVIF